MSRDPDVTPDDPITADDLRFQHRYWAVERVAWWVELGVALAALSGLFGGGPLARGRATAPGLRVDYERLARCEAPGEVRVEVDPALARAGALRLRVPTAWLEEAGLERIVPEPAGTEPGGEATTLTFDPPRGAGPAVVRLELRHAAIGRRRGWIEVAGGPRAIFVQWTYP